MYMQVGHAGQDQPIAVIQDRQRGIPLRQRIEYARDAAILNDGAGIFLADQLVHAAAVAEISLYNIIVHVLCAPFRRALSWPVQKYHIIMARRISTYVLGRSSRNPPPAFLQI